MSQFELDERTRVLLDRVRHSTATLSVYEMPPDLAEAAVWETGVPPITWTLGLWSVA